MKLCFCKRSAAKTLAELIPRAERLGRAFRLRHTFSEHPTLTKGTTNNLMDYTDSTHLFKYQWDYIHDPEAMIALWQDEEEGAKYGGNCLFTEWIEKIRHAAHNNEILKKKVGITEGVTNIILSDNSFVSDIRIHSRDGFNTRINENNVKIRELNRWKEKMIYFQFGEQISIFNGCPVHELEIITKPEDKENLIKYLFEKSNWKTKVREHFVDMMIKGRKAAVDFMNCLPDEYYADLSVFHRMDILHTLNGANNIKERWFGGADEEGIVVQVIKTTPKYQISDLFDKLEENNLIIDLYKKIHDVFGKDNQTKFMSELFYLYYKQSPFLIELCADYSTDEFIPWVDKVKGNQQTCYYDYHTNFYSKKYFSNKMTFSNNPKEGDIVITADYYYKTYKWIKNEYSILPKVVSPFKCLPVYFYTKVDFIGIKDMILPMPAIFFKWINEEVTEKDIECKAKLAAKIVAVAIPGYKLLNGTKSIATKIIAISSLITASGDLFIELSDLNCQKMGTTVYGRRFCSMWNHLSSAVNAASTINDVVSEKLPLFTILSLTWDNLLNDENINVQEVLGDKKYLEISNTIKEIDRIIKQ
jgi:hypothetical protein